MRFSENKLCKQKEKIYTYHERFHRNNSHVHQKIEHNIIIIIYLFLHIIERKKTSCNILSKNEEWQKNQGYLQAYNHMSPWRILSVSDMFGSNRKSEPTENQTQ